MRSKNLDNHDGAKLRVAVVVARFNEVVTSRLLIGAKEALAARGVSDDAVDVVWTPGAFEIPIAAKCLAETGRYAGIVCLGCVVRGDTPHFDYVCASSINGIQQAALATGVPMGMGVLTTDNVGQAMARAGTGGDNKGWEAALTALEMVKVLRDVASR